MPLRQHFQTTTTWFNQSWMNRHRRTRSEPLFNSFDPTASHNSGRSMPTDANREFKSHRPDHLDFTGFPQRKAKSYNSQLQQRRRSQWCLSVSRAWDSDRPVKSFIRFRCIPHLLSLSRSCDGANWLTRFSTGLLASGVR